MTQYKYQTNTTLLKEGELGVSGGQLVTNNGSAVVAVGNPANSTAVAVLAQTYAQEVMDIATAQTLGSGFVFLNGTSFDAMGSSDYEFEESNGTVFGLYGRTDGMNQQIYYAGAANNQSDLQFTTVPYAPSFLSSSIWAPAAIIGGDVFGFVLVLRDTTGATLTFRYLYIKHGGSLINTSGHTYVEITALVNSYMTTIGMDPGGLPKVVRVGAYFFIGASSWTQGYIALGGWNAQDTTFPFGSAALASSAPAYAPTTFTVQAVNWPNMATTTAAQFPKLMGNAVAGQTVTDLFRIYDVTNSVLTSPVNGNWPLPPVVQWVNSSPMFLDGEVDGSGNPYLAFGAPGECADVNANAPGFELVYSLNVTFTAGSAGAWTNAHLNYNTAGSGGTDLLHCQPFPFIVGFNPTESAPNEAVNSNVSVPSTCVNKLPFIQHFAGSSGNAYNSQRIVNYYYSGFGSVVQAGGTTLYRGRTQLEEGGHLGSAAATQINKLSHIYPMYNVIPRFNFSSTGSLFSKAKVQPSGILTSIAGGIMIAADTIVSTGSDTTGRLRWVVSNLPTSSTIGDKTFNRGGTSVPGMGARVSEFYTNNAAAANSTLSTLYNVYTVGLSNIRNPLNAKLPSLASSSANSPNPNSQTMGIGNWTLSGTVYNEPSSTVWTTSASMSTQIAAVRSTAFAAALVFNSGRFGTLLSCEVVPILNSAGTGISMALGVIWVANGVGSAATSLQEFFFTTPCSVSGGIISLTNTASTTIVGQSSQAGLNGVPGTNTSNDTFFGRLHHVYLDATNQYLEWTPANGLVVNGDTWTCNFIAQLSGTTVSSYQAFVSSISRAFFQCHPQTNGLTWSSQTGVSIPQFDIPLARYTTSAVTTAAGFTASFTQALSTPQQQSNFAELMTLQAINNNFLLQLGAVNGRLNHKQYNLPSTFIDMTTFAVGTYYLYLQDTGVGGIQLVASALQVLESATSMYFGTFQRTLTGFTAESSVAELIRFGTARLVSGSAGVAMQGSQIRIGPYVG